MPTPSSVRSRSRSGPPLLYLSWRATFTCLALARPRPIGSTPSNIRGLARPLFPALSNTGFVHMVRRVASPASGARRAFEPSCIYYGTCFVPRALPSRTCNPHPTPRHGYQGRLGRQPDAPQPADLGHPPLSQPVGGHGGRHAFLVRQREDLLGRDVDLFGAHAGPLEVETGPLVRDLDDPARVDQVVGGVQDAPVGGHLLRPGMRDLVVGATAADAGGHSRHRLAGGRPPHPPRGAAIRAPRRHSGRPL